MIPTVGSRPIRALHHVSLLRCIYAQVEEKKTRMVWNRERDIALLAQISSKGVAAFATAKANGKDGKKFNQAEAWTNPEDGILTLLAKHEAFEGVHFSAYQSVINHVTGSEGLLKKHRHLFTEGMEQNEPAAAGTTGTKDESALGEFENLIIEVAELQREAKELEKEKRCAAKAAEEKLAREGKVMQDKAVEKRYGSISLDELSKVGARV